MLNFFKREYKTILIVLLLLGGLFTWFYLDEARKLKLVEKESDYLCFVPTKSLAGYSLGESLELSKFKDFVDIESHHNKWLISLQNADKSLRLNFADAKLVSIEYYPAIGSTGYLNCRADGERFQETASVTQANLDLGDSRLVRYKGLGIFYAPDPKAADELEVKPQIPVGWMLLPIEDI